MPQTITQIELTFENLDFIRIPFSSFAYFSMQDTLHEIGYRHSNKEHSYSAVNDLRFVLKAEANQPAAYYDDYFQDDYGLFARIMRQDITQIDLLYADGTTVQHSVCWESEIDNEYRNQLQLCALHTDGQLYVEIAKDSDQHHH